MGGLFRDKEHLVRMAGLFGVGFLLFLLLRGVLIPADFGVYGHFRAGALADNASASLHFAGRAACESCHDDVAAAKSAGPHARIGCETCHGPLMAHASAPENLQPELPAATPLCVRCHASNVARPETFPQVDPSEHAEGEPCDGCHSPHNPLG